nr:probable bifunctional methylthioribulose-1-phosphate dehydratase/enolase-phosphatase E1 [Quercus suber]
MCNAGAVIHSHGIESCLVTMLNPLSKEFRITHMEMIKGIKGHGYYDELVVPIIENTAYEFELTESLAKAIEAYPKTTAVLVRNHGIYIWGDSWISAKTQVCVTYVRCESKWFIASCKYKLLVTNHGIFMGAFGN